MQLRLKELKGSANVLCQMATSQRICESVDVIADLPDGDLSLNLLNGMSCHSTKGQLELPIGAELSEWFANRLSTLEIPPDAVGTADLVISYRTDRVPTDRERILLLDLDARSHFEVEGSCLRW